MAKEKIIEIKTGEVIKNIQDLKNNIAALKNGWTDAAGTFHKGLQQMTIGTDEYRTTLRSLEDNQAALRNAMHATAAEYTEVIKASTAADIELTKSGKIAMEDTYSYNQLVRTLADLKEQWRSTTNTAQRLKLGEKIDAVNNKLKSLDASVGVYGRNVGNYLGAVDHLTAGLAKMGGGAAAAAGKVGILTTSFKTMSATPAVAILGLLANVLTKVIDSLESSEENAQGLLKALAPFEAIGDAIVQMLQAAGKVLVEVVGWVGKLTQAIIGNNEAAEKRLKIAKEQNDLDISMRNRMIQDAKDEREVAELRAKASERLTYTAKERLAFLQEAGRLESEISRRGVEDARKQYEIIKARNAVSKSGKKELDDEARAYADMIKAETAYYTQLRQINQGITRARKELIKEERNAAKAIRDAATAKLSAEKEYLSELLSITRTGSESRLKIQNEVAARERDKQKADAREKITNARELARSLALIDKAYQVQVDKNQQEHDNSVLKEDLRSIANRRDALQKGSVEYAAAQKEYAEKALDGLRRQMDETDAEFKARQLAAQRALVEAGNAMNDAVLKETTDGLKAQMAAVAEGSVEYYALALESAQAELEGIYQGIDESLDEFNARRMAKARAVREAEDALVEAQVDRDRIIIEQRMALLEESSPEYLALAVQMKQLELDTLHQLEGESNDAFRLRELQAEKAFSDAQKALIQGRISVFQQYASAISGLFSGIADLYEQDTEESKEAAERAKNLRVAGAVIDTISGAVGAYMGAQNSGLPPYISIPLGIVSAAAVTTAGMANVAKIKATPVSEDGGSASSASVPASVSAPTLEPQVNEVRTITSASEEERLNQMASDQRVYILDSDLQASDDARRVRVAETTF